MDALEKLRPCLDSEIALFLIKSIYYFNPHEIIASMLDNHTESWSKALSGMYGSFAGSQHTCHTCVLVGKGLRSAVNSSRAEGLHLPAWVLLGETPAKEVKQRACSARSERRSSEKSVSAHKTSVSPRNSDNQTLLQPIDSNNCSMRGKSDTKPSGTNYTHWEKKACNQFSYNHPNFHC